MDFKRYLYPQINWDSSVIGIMGERGIKEKYANPDDTFYISLDHYWFGTHELQDLIKFMYKRGITEFYIDNAKVDMSRRQTPYTLKGMSFRVIYTIEAPAA